MEKCTYISQMGTVYFYSITQRAAVIPCRRYGTTMGRTREDGADRLSRNVCKELPLLAA